MQQALQSRPSRVRCRRPTDAPPLVPYRTESQKKGRGVRAPTATSVARPPKGSPAPRRRRELSRNAAGTPSTDGDKTVTNARDKKATRADSRRTDQTDAALFQSNPPAQNQAPSRRVAAASRELASKKFPSQSSISRFAKHSTRFLAHEVIARTGCVCFSDGHGFSRAKTLF